MKYKYMQNTPKQPFLEDSKVNNGEWMEGMLERITENKVEIQMCTITYWVKEFSFFSGVYFLLLDSINMKH